MMKRKVFNLLRKSKIFKCAWKGFKIFLFAIMHPFPSYRKIRRDGLIVQMVDTFSERDAIGNFALELSNKLTSFNKNNYIVYCGSHSKISNSIPVLYFRFNKEDTVIYHMGIGSNMSKIYKRINVKKKILYYHNITPAKYFYDMPVLKQACKNGRIQLYQMKECTDMALCDSKFNESELKNIGYLNTYVSGIVSKVNGLITNKKIRKNNKKEILTIGRITRNKCIEDVIKSFYEFQKIISNSVLYIVGKIDNFNYYNELIKLCNSLKISNNVFFDNNANDDKLIDYYNNADIYICMSEHEGFCVPLIEAMAYGVPIIAYDCSAIPEILGNAGILIKEKKYRLISNSMIDIIRKDSYFLAEAGKKRYKSFFDNKKNINNIIRKIMQN